MMPSSPRRRAAPDRSPFRLIGLIVPLLAAATSHAQGPVAPPPGGAPPAAVPAAKPAAIVPEHACGVDLALAGQMSDVLSNALARALKIPGGEVRTFLDVETPRAADGPSLLSAAAAHFKIDPVRLAAEVEAYKHCNCGVMRMPDELASLDAEADLVLTPFACDVALHVVLHEMGHALIREFDIPVLGNEETVADAFATHYLTTHLPERAVAVLKARVTSLMIEAEASPSDDWRGEHDHDGRRAFKIAAIAVAADPVKYKPVGDLVGMSPRDVSRAADYGAEIHRSWRRTLGPLWMPAGQASAKARVVIDESSPLMQQVQKLGLIGEVESALRRFDWHSQVAVNFTGGEGGAAWSRSSRTIKVNSQYLRRFIEQGSKVAMR
jgi:hypothetical protein